jgi:hypothetical protein
MPCSSALGFRSVPLHVCGCERCGRVKQVALLVAQLHIGEGNVRIARLRRPCKRSAQRPIAWWPPHYQKTNTRLQKCEVCCMLRAWFLCVVAWMRTAMHESVSNLIIQQRRRHCWYRHSTLAKEFVTGTAPHRSCVRHEGQSKGSNVYVFAWMHLHLRIRPRYNDRAHVKLHHGWWPVALTLDDPTTSGLAGHDAHNVVTCCCDSSL